MGINTEEVTFILSQLIRFGNALDVALKKEKDAKKRAKLKEMCDKAAKYRDPSRLDRVREQLYKL